MPRARATRAAWYSAAAMLISGSRPLADAVMRSTGIGRALSGSAAFSAAIRPFTASTIAGFNGPRFEPPELAAFVGIGALAEGRPQKCFGPTDVWPINAEPMTLLPLAIRLPAAWSANAVCAIAVTTSG